MMRRKLCAAETRWMAREERTGAQRASIRSPAIELTGDVERSGARGDRIARRARPSRRAVRRSGCAGKPICVRPERSGRAAIRRSSRGTCTCARQARPGAREERIPARGISASEIGTTRSQAIGFLPTRSGFRFSQRNGGTNMTCRNAPPRWYWPKASGKMTPGATNFRALITSNAHDARTFGSSANDFAHAPTSSARGSISLPSR